MTVFIHPGRVRGVITKVTPHTYVLHGEREDDWLEVRRRGSYYEVGQEIVEDNDGFWKVVEPVKPITREQLEAQAQLMLERARNMDAEGWRIAVQSELIPARFVPKDKQ